MGNTLVSHEGRAKLREWAVLAAKGRLVLSGSIVLPSLKAAVSTVEVNQPENIPSQNYFMYHPVFASLIFEFPAVLLQEAGITEENFTKLVQHAQIPTTDTKDVPMITNLSKLGVNVVNVRRSYSS